MEGMESDLGKLFIGGISWDTDEERLKEYFGRYGEVVQAVIMRDRATGRARGFGFLIFSDPLFAERVILDKHVIDGRTVEAKKAVPKEDQHVTSKNFGSINGSPGPTRTKKIFVGGLPSTVTESDFKQYFDHFGSITDVVVMYDHNTQRPRGFGFITFESEEAVDRVLHKTFHELCGKMVEVKRAVPKELSPPNRSPLGGNNYGLNRGNSFLNSYAPGYNISSPGGFGIRMDRFSPTANIRSGFSTFGNVNYGSDPSPELGLSFSYGRNANFGSNIGNGQTLSAYYNGNPGRYTTPIGFNGAIGRNSTILSSTTQNLWGNGLSNSSMNSPNLSPECVFSGSGNGSFGGTIGNNRSKWNSLPIRAEAGFGYGKTGKNSGFGYGRFGNSGTIPSSVFSTKTSGCDASFWGLYNGSSVYGGSSWESRVHELEGSDSIQYELGNLTSDVPVNSLENFIGNYNVSSRQSSRGIAARKFVCGYTGVDLVKDCELEKPLFVDIFSS